MPEASFPSNLQIPDSDIAPGRPGIRSLFARLRDRATHVLDRMSVFGAPASSYSGSALTGAGSDTTLTTNQTQSGLFYRRNFTVNSGVIITIDWFLVIICTTKIRIAGTLNAAGQGMAAGAGGAVGQPGSAGAAGIGGRGGGGGGGSSGAAGGAGGAVFRSAGGAGGAGAGANGSTPSVPASRDREASILAAAGFNIAIFGGGGGGGGSGASATVAGSPGGAGGGILILIAPEVDLTGGTLNCNGAAGGNNGGLGGSGGGGGGGLVYVEAKVFAPPTSATVAGGAGGTGSSGDGGAGSAGLLQYNIFA